MSPCLDTPRFPRMVAIEAHELRRMYQRSTVAGRHRAKDVEAVRGVSFAVRAGELYGLLGPNGAGKTTTIKMLTTLLVPSGGYGARARSRRGRRGPACSGLDRMRLRW